MLLPLLVNLAVLAAPAERLAVIGAAPNFALRDQNDRPVRLADFRGRVVVVGFIFTTCNGTCPATTHRMAKLREACARRPDLKDRVQFVSISLDPERDVPERLRGYMRLYEIEGGDWTFLTGTAKEVAPVLAAWGMWAKPAPGGQLDHPSRVYLVDASGRIREIYNLDFFRLPWVLEDISALIGSGPAKSPKPGGRS
jgi:protein SCO1/2